MAPNELKLLNQFNSLNFGQGVSAVSTFRQQFGGISMGNGCNLGYILAGIEDIENVGSGNSEQQAAGIQSLIDKALSIVTSIVNAEAAAAKAEDAKHSKNVQKTNNKSSELENELNNSFNEIKGNIDSESEVVQNAIGEVEDASEKLEEEKEKIQKIIEDIQSAQQELAIATDPEDQKTILANIQILSGQLAASTEVIAALQETVTCASKEVQSSYEAIENLSGKATEVQSNGEDKLTQIVQETSEEVQKNTEIQTKGKTNQLTSVEAQKAAELASSNIFTGTSIAPKLYRVSTDQENASGIREASSATNLKTLLQGILKINDNLSILESFNTSIGSALTDYSGYIGDWNSKLEPMITSFGSLTDDKNGVGAVVQNINSAVTNDLNTIGSSSKSKNENGNKSQQEKLNIWQQNQQTNEPSEKQQLNNLETPKVKITFGL